MKRWWKVFVKIGGTVGTWGEQQHNDIESKWKFKWGYKRCL